MEVAGISENNLRITQRVVIVVGRIISIGNQSFSSVREQQWFYIDKTDFIRQWWGSGDIVTLFTRPRRFGKTFNMSMLECFFSEKYADRTDLFQGLKVWEDESYRKLQGTYPVLFLSFAPVKLNTAEKAIRQIKGLIEDLFNQYDFLLDGQILNEKEEKFFLSVKRDMEDDTAVEALHNLCKWLSRAKGKNVIILLDEYDTPLQEAWVNGYWDEMTAFIRSLFNATFKTNPYLERAIMTGITRVSKESIFSDLNNLKVVTSTSGKYADCFGFTEEEVFAALDEMELSAEKEKVRDWYDGFTFGNHTHIYNPWSITCFLDEKKYQTWWADTSSNSLVVTLLRQGTPEVKQDMETLLYGGTITTGLDEQIVFSQLGRNKNAIWSLLLASGYLRIVSADIGGADGKNSYTLTLTNREVRVMFDKMIRDWINNDDAPGNLFLRGLLKGSLKEMNYYMNKIALNTISYYDSGSRPSAYTEPERFYHGFLLGMLVELRDTYEVRSNRESGLGRYDVMLIPRKLHQPDMPPIILEFKVYDPEEEKDLHDTLASAHRQIADRNYDADLIERGFPREDIRHYAFAFEGKKVLIG